MGNVHRRFGMPGPHQNPAITGHQREHMAWRNDVFGVRFPVYGHGDGARPVGGGYASGDALAGLDGDGEGGLVTRGVLCRHESQPQTRHPFSGQGKTDQPASVLGHEIDGLGARLFGGDDQITLVLAAFIINQNKHPPGHSFGDDVLDGGKMLPVGHGYSFSIKRAT